MLARPGQQNWTKALATWTCPTNPANSVGGACDPCGQEVGGWVGGWVGRERRRASALRFARFPADLRGRGVCRPPARVPPRRGCCRPCPPLLRTSRAALLPRLPTVPLRLCGSIAPHNRQLIRFPPPFATGVGQLGAHGLPR